MKEDPWNDILKSCEQPIRNDRELHTVTERIDKLALVPKGTLDTLDEAILKRLIRSAEDYIELRMKQQDRWKYIAETDNIGQANVS